MRDITIKQYKSLPLRKKVLYEPLNSLIPSKFFGDYELDISKMSWEQVKGVMKTLKNFSSWQSVTDIYETCFGISTDEFWESSIIDYFAARPYIAKTFKALKEKEIKLLHGNDADSVLWENAGGKRLDPFGDIIPLNQLGKIYGCYPMDFSIKSYNEILTLLVINKIQNEVDTEFNKLKRQMKT